MSTLVPRPDTRPAPHTGTALVPLPEPQPPAARPGRACPVPPRRPTSGIPIVGYIPPPPYECTRTRAVFRRITIEIVRTGLWVLALIPFIVINTFLLTRAVLRAHVSALTRLLNHRTHNPARVHAPFPAQAPASAATVRCVNCAATTTRGPAGEVPRGWFHRLGVGLLCPACLAADLHLPARTFQ